MPAPSASYLGAFVRHISAESNLSTSQLPTGLSGGICRPQIRSSDKKLSEQTETQKSKGFSPQKLHKQDKGSIYIRSLFCSRNFIALHWQKEFCLSTKYVKKQTNPPPRKFHYAAIAWIVCCIELQRNF